jgi:hypothetical protein
MPTMGGTEKIGKIRKRVVSLQKKTTLYLDISEGGGSREI